jgi:hypothetical protein
MIQALWGRKSQSDSIRDQIVLFISVGYIYTPEPIVRG